MSLINCKKPSLNHEIFHEWLAMYESGEIHI